MAAHEADTHSDRDHESPAIPVTRSDHISYPVRRERNQPGQWDGEEGERPRREVRNRMSEGAGRQLARAASASSVRSGSTARDRVEVTRSRRAAIRPPRTRRW